MRLNAMLHLRPQIILMNGSCPNGKNAQCLHASQIMMINAELRVFN